MADLYDVIARRRTSLRVDPDRPVPAELLQRLCVAAAWAPNHHRTWPWRFAVFSGDARRRLGEALAGYEEARGAAEAKVAKARTKYLRSPVVLAVGCAADPDPVTAMENRDAVAAAVQNLLLAATAEGLASYWGTGAVTEAPAVKALCGLEPADELVALVYLGWPVGLDPEAPARPEPEIRWLA
jgi:nitroreductase